MTKAHLKRLFAPKTWPIQRKATKYVVRPRPGGTRLIHALPLRLLLTEVLRLAETSAEASRIALEGKLLVDGKKVANIRGAVGLMGVIEIPSRKERFRMLINRKGKLTVQPISGEEAEFKLCRIVRKWMAPGNIIMVSTHDGRTFKADKSWKLGDTLVVNIPGTLVNQTLALKEESVVFLTGGGHIGRVCTISKIEGKNLVIKLDKEAFSTPKKFAFVVGEKKPVIKVENDR